MPFTSWTRLCAQVANRLTEMKNSTMVCRLILGGYHFQSSSATLTDIKLVFMRKNYLVAGLLILSASLFSLSCKKDARQLPGQSENGTKIYGKDQGQLKQTKTFSSDVVIRWLNMELNMLRVPAAA